MRLLSKITDALTEWWLGCQCASPAARNAAQCSVGRHDSASAERCIDSHRGSCNWDGTRYARPGSALANSVYQIRHRESGDLTGNVHATRQPPEACCPTRCIRPDITNLCGLAGCAMQFQRAPGSPVGRPGASSAEMQLRRSPCRMRFQSRPQQLGSQI